MSVPEIVRERLGDEEVRARVPLGGDDELVVTPSRTLAYRAEGLLSGESVEEYSHQAERLSVTEGRRKCTLRLDHGLDGESEFTIPSKNVDETLKPIIGGVLSSVGVTEADESVRDIFRLGELSIVVTDGRVIKHIGNDLWDEEFEEYAFAGVTGLDVEKGDVSSQIIIEVDGRPQRIKTPTDMARGVRQAIQSALLDFYDVDSYAAFVDKVAPADEEPAEPVEASAEPESADAAEEQPQQPEEESADTVGGLELTFSNQETQSVEETAVETDQQSEIAEEVAVLREAVERQNEILQSHQRTIEKLIEELRRGR